MRYSCLYPGCIGTAQFFLCEVHQFDSDVQMAQEALASMRKELKEALEQNKEDAETIKELEDRAYRYGNQVDDLEDRVTDLKVKVADLIEEREERLKNDN